MKIHKTIAFPRLIRRIPIRFPIKCFTAIFLMALNHACGRPNALLNIHALGDSSSFESVHILFRFSQEPESFPIYAMTNPERIVIDMPGTVNKAGGNHPSIKIRGIKTVDLNEKQVSGEPVLRATLFLTGPTEYTARLYGEELTITLLLAGETTKRLTLLKNTSPYGNAETAVQIMELMEMKDAIELKLSFSHIPQSASVYMLTAPHRIIMDLNGVTVPEPFEKKIEPAPVKKISVISKPEMPDYTGVVVHLKKPTPYRYKLYRNTMIINIKKKSPPSGKKKLITYIGAGAILAGGTATGIWLGVRSKSGEKNEDLGEPPKLPDF